MYSDWRFCRYWLNQELFFDWLKFILAGAAFRADPIVRQILKSSAGFHPIIRVARSRVVDVSTYKTFVLLHILFELLVFICVSIYQQIVVGKQLTAINFSGPPASW